MLRLEAGDMPPVTAIFSHVSTEESWNLLIEMLSESIILERAQITLQTTQHEKPIICFYLPKSEQLEGHHAGFERCSRTSCLKFARFTRAIFVEATPASDSFI